MRFCQVFSRTQEIYWVLYFSQIFTDEQKPFSEQGEQAEKWWPLPRPLPRREGRDYRDTPIRRTKASCCPLLVSTIAETLCELCMPKAFCGLEMCAKNLRELCALCERKNISSVRGKAPNDLNKHPSHE